MLLEYVAKENINCELKTLKLGTSLVDQGLRIHLPMLGT